MNAYVKAQITNMIAMTKVFKQSCLLAVKKDDGTIDRSEQKMLEKINKASERFIQEVEAINR